MCFLVSVILPPPLVFESCRVSTPYPYSMSKRPRFRARARRQLGGQGMGQSGQLLPVEPLWQVGSQSRFSTAAASDAGSAIAVAAARVARRERRMTGFIVVYWGLVGGVSFCVVKRRDRVGDGTHTLVAGI